MSIQILKVTGKSRLRKFILFPKELYRDCGNWVPALEGDEYDTFNPRRNGAFEYCSADCFLAVKDGEIAGRVAAIINHRANDRWGEATVRFGWLDFIEDQEVCDALLDAVAEWGRARGCNKLKGPWGFTDMDKEGALVEGFDKLSPFTCLYNYPYYDRLIVNSGLRKDVDWVQYSVRIDGHLPSAFKYVERLGKESGFHIAEASSAREMGRKYGLPLFRLYNEAFSPLSQFSPLTDRQIHKYLSTYVPIMSPKFICVCLDREEKPVGFAFCVPSLSKAVKKSGGRLLPFGFLRIMRAIRKNDTLEALLIGVLPEYQSQGVPLIMFKYLHDNCVKFGIKTIIMNPQLESNVKVQSLFSGFSRDPYMRRRTYVKEI